MYISKWWGNMTCGDTEDSTVLIDYFAMHNKKEYSLNEILKDAQLENALGKTPLHMHNSIECYFWLGDLDSEDKYQVDIDIPINVVIDLGALLLQTLVEEVVTIEDMTFSISAEKDELKLIISELQNAIKQPELYYPDFLQEEFAEMKDGIIEIYTHLERYC